jgi:phosphoribosyl 1,2-cyclic phosphodiesterase
VLRFASLGSGSSGNATLVQAGDGITTTRVLIDCGFSLRELETRLARHALACSDLDAVFITHEHGDHAGCALALTRRHGVPLWMSRGTWHAVDDGVDCERVNFARDGVSLTLGDLELCPYTVPHDAREPLQLTCSDGARKLGVLTDAGSVTRHLLDALTQCDALLLECNHDPEMLARSGYPARLKDRIAGPRGHLSNEAAAEILAASRHAGLRHVVAAHLSERNNRPDLARTALAAALGCRPCHIDVADPAVGFDWRAV